MVQRDRSAVLAGEGGRRSLKVPVRLLAFMVALVLVGIAAFYLLYFYKVRESTVDPNELEWAPPALNNPTTLNITSTGYTETKLDTTNDYVIKLPAQRKVGATVLDGGHNVVIKGGYLTVPRNDGVGKDAGGL